MAGQFSHEDGSAAGGFAGEWLPSGLAGVGPVTTILVRESRLGPGGPTFRGLRLSHDDQLALGKIVSVRYGADFVVAGFNGTTSALRPRAEVAVQIARNWQASATVATHPWLDDAVSAGAMQSALDTLDAFPTMLIRNGRPVLENGLHEEISIDRALGPHADLIASVFHDLASHTAVIGRGGSGSPDYLQDYFSDAFAYDGGSSSSGGARLVYRQKFSNNLSTTVVYAYAGALAPNGIASTRACAKSWRRAIARAWPRRSPPRSRASARNSPPATNGSAGPRSPARTPMASPFTTLIHILSMEIRQPLPSVFPGHMEVQANMGNLLGPRLRPNLRG